MKTCETCVDYRDNEPLGQYCFERLLADTGEEITVKPDQEACENYHGNAWQVGDKLSGEGETE